MKDHDKNNPNIPLSQDQQIRDLNQNITGHKETERLLRVDVTGHKETERLLRVDVAYKDVLLQEISHRVLNSFHLISGMLQLQARRSPDESIKQQLEIAAQRVLSLSLVHKRLYESAEDITRVNAKVYLHGLCNELRQGFFSSDIGGNRTLSLDSVDDLDLPTDTMAVIGLAVSELVTNACKYAYKPAEQGVVSVALTRGDGEYRLSVGDTGKGLSPDFDIDQSRGLGMSIVRAQVKELGGMLVIDRAPPGTRFVIHIPE